MSIFGTSSNERDKKCAKNRGQDRRIGDPRFWLVQDTGTQNGIRCDTNAQTGCDNCRHLTNMTSHLLRQQHLKKTEESDHDDEAVSRGAAAAKASQR